MKEKRTALLLAGGKSSRMGTDKGLIKIDGRITIVERIIDQLRDLFDEIIIVTNTPDSYNGFETIVMEDLIKEKGPLGGIFSGLSFSTSEYSFVVGCDMPFIRARLIEYIIDKPREYDVVIPERNGRFESLFARYSKSVLPALFTHIMKDELRIQDILKELHVLKISPEEVEKFDPEQKSFLNINSPEDLEKLQASSR